MGKKILNISISLLVFAYMVANVGFAVHECHDIHTSDVLLLIGDISCENIHGVSHICEGDHKSDESCSDSCENHSDECCAVKTYNLSDEQDVKNSSDRLLLTSLSYSIDAFIANSIADQAYKKIAVIAYSPPPNLVGKTKMILNSTWRL